MKTEHYTPGDILIGDYPVATRTVTIAQGQVLPRGAVLGAVAGKFVLSEAASSDGSESPSVILAIDVDASAGDVQKSVYSSGEFDGARLTYGDGHSSQSVDAAFNAVSAPLFVRTLA